MYDPYSWLRAFRGSMDDLHFAMGFEPGNFTYRGLTQGLPVSHGRWVCSQLIAASIRLNFDLPLFLPVRRERGQRQVWCWQGRARLWCKEFETGRARHACAQQTEVRLEEASKASLPRRLRRRPRRLRQRGRCSNVLTAGSPRRLRRRMLRRRRISACSEGGARASASPFAGVVLAGMHST
eukprot:1838230-Pleurochrysis_carterae.AAC.1